MTAKQAPKAEQELRHKYWKKVNRRIDELMDEAEANGHGSDPRDWTDDEHEEVYNQAASETSLTFMEKVKVIGPIYAPVILLGLGTLGCIAGAQILNTRQQAALIGAYALLQQDFAGYRNEIRDTYGEEADKKALTESRKKNAQLESEIKRLEAIKGVETFGIATLPGVIFRSDMANIERAFLHFNRNLILRGWGDLEELYSFLGLPEEGLKIINRAPDEIYGWNAYINEVEFGCAWFDYRLTRVETADGSPAYLIDFDIPPYQLEGDNDDSYADRVTYEGYLPGEAKETLRRGIEQVPFLIDSASFHVGPPHLA